MSHAMQKHRRIFRNGALIAVAACVFVISAGFARADDTTSTKAAASPSPSPAAKSTQTTAPAKQTVAANPVKTDDKSAKQDLASASKADLFTLSLIHI